MVNLVTKTEIGKWVNGEFVAKYTFDYSHECEINSSWENITSTARIVIPKKINMQSRVQNADGTYEVVPATFTGEDAIIKKKDAIRIWAGYDYPNKNGFTTEMPLQFDGFVTNIDPSFPVTIQCEDVMFLLKQRKIKFFEKASATLDDIMQGILPKDDQGNLLYPYKVEDVNIGKFKVEDATVIETLDYLRRTFGFSVFFQDGVIYCGFKYQTSKIGDFIADESKTPLFHFQHNIIESKSLKWQDKDDIDYQVKVINIKDKNKRTEKTYGDLDGEIRTIHFYDANDADLEKLAMETLNKMKYTGYRGSFKTFLLPKIVHGTAVELQDEILADRNGTYLVSEVTTTFGMNGGRQVITLNRAIA